MKAKKDEMSIKLVWLEHYIKGIGMAGPPSVQHLFRAYVLYLIGTRLMPNYLENLIHLKWLSLLVKSPQEVEQYNWGSACLATLYLCVTLQYMALMKCMGAQYSYRHGRG